MRILAIDIDGFGKLQQYQQVFDRDLQVCYGENEAGKSTIYAFIHAVLFGFPSKLNGTSNFEPRQGSSFGGSVTIELGDQQYKVERTKKRVGTEVKVYFPDGKIGGEADLKTILQGLDRKFFEQIFSFSLDGLQEVFKLDENEIGRFLFYTGVSGSDQLWDTEKHLDKAIEKLYKPQGKIPRINVVLDQLKKSAIALKKAKEAETEHEHLLESQVLCEHRSLEIDKLLVEVEGKLSQYEEQKRLMPLALERKAAEARLEEMRDFSFPANGLERMKTCLARLAPQQEMLTQKQQKYHMEQEALSAIVVDEKVLAVDYEIEQCKTFLTKLETLIEQNKSLSIGIEQKTEEISTCEDQLHLRLSDVQVTELDTSLFAKKKIGELENSRSDLLRKSGELEQKYTVSKEQLAALETEIEYLERKQISSGELREIETQLQSGDQHILLLEVENAIARLALKGKVPERNHKIVYYLGAAGLTTLALMLLLLMDGSLLLPALLFVIALVMAGFPFVRGRSADRQSEIASERAYYEDKKSQLLAATISAESRQLLEAKRHEQHQLLEDVRLKRARRADCLEDVRQTELTLGQVDHDLALVQTEQLQLGKQYGLPEQVIESSMVAAFEQLEQLKKLVNERYKLENQQTVKQSEMHLLLNQITQVANNVGLEATDDYQSVVQRLGKRLAEAKLMVQEKQTRSRRMTELESELEPLRVTVATLQNEKAQLLELSGCSDEENFYHKAAVEIDLVSLREKFRMLNTQIGHFDFMDMSASALQLEIDNLNDEYEQFKLERSGVAEQLAELKQGVRLIESAGQVETRALEHQQNIEVYRAEAAEWMKLTVAKGILQKATRTFKEEKLPEIVAQAQQYLLFLTEGEYEKIQFDHEDGLHLLDRFGNLVPARDLSRGTAEMLYTALRFSFIVSLQEKMTLPIIIDDSFVNFDKHRTERVFQLLHEMSKSQQILFFTCHEHVLAHFDQSNVATIGEFQLSFFG